MWWRSFSTSRSGAVGFSSQSRIRTWRARPVSITTRVPARSAVRSAACRNSQPLIRGISRSRRTRSGGGGWPCSHCSASRPSQAVATQKPESSKRARRNSRFASSSSTIRIRCSLPAGIPETRIPLIYTATQPGCKECAVIKCGPAFLDSARPSRPSESAAYLALSTAWAARPGK